MSDADKHYQTVPGEQHHARAIRLGLNWYQGNITKYAERAPHKGSQIDDLIKVLDYTTMWLESPEKAINPVMLSQGQREKIDLIAKRLYAMGNDCSSKQVEQFTELSPDRKWPNPRVPRNYPGDGPVEEGAADSRYTNQDRPQPIDVGEYTARPGRD